MKFYLWAIGLWAIGIAAQAQTHCHYDGMGIVIAEIIAPTKTKKLEIQLTYGTQTVPMVRNEKRKKKKHTETVSFPFATGSFIGILPAYKTAPPSDSLYITVTDRSPQPRYAFYKQSFSAKEIHYLCVNHKALWANEKKPLQIVLKKLN